MEQSKQLDSVDAEGAKRAREAVSLPMLGEDETHKTPIANTSGMGVHAKIPDGVKRFSAGASILSGPWGWGNKSWLGLAAYLPYVGVLFAIYLGFKGREMAWRNKRWESVEHFNKVQKKWDRWGILVAFVLLCLTIVRASPPWYSALVK